MKTRRRDYSEDRLTVNRRNKRVKTSEKGGENALPIPIDLVFEIFSRLPLESIAICRCVSKIWASMLSRKEFTDLFSSKAYARPQLLFTCEDGSDELLVYSSPQPQNLDENSPPIIPSYHMSFSFDGEYEISGVVNGLICVQKSKYRSNGRKETVPVLCNPSTGESLPLKKVKTSRAIVRSMLGYDPIDKGFKVLSMTWGRSQVEEELQVLTLGTDKWRMVEYGIPGRHNYLAKELCINGFLYRQGTNAICCFDIRFEKFSMIKFDETMPWATLINYNGNLGLLWPGTVDGSYDQTCTSLKLWVLEDVKRQDWSKRIIELPPMWNYVVGQSKLNVVGVIGTNEIVLQAYDLDSCLFYLNTDKNTIVRVEIQGIDWYNCDLIGIFMNHVEDVKLM